MDQERGKYPLLKRPMSRRGFLAFAGTTLFLTACGDTQPSPNPTPTPTSSIGPHPETTPSPTIAQLTPDQFASEEQQLYQNGNPIDVLLGDRTLLLDPTLGNAALLKYINGTEQGVSVNDVFRLTLRSNQQGATDVHGLVPKASQAGSILLPASQQFPNISAFEGPVVNVKILTFSDTDIYSNQGLALLCTNLKTQ